MAIYIRNKTITGVVTHLSYSWCIVRDSAYVRIFARSCEYVHDIRVINDERKKRNANSSFFSNVASSGSYCVPDKRETAYVDEGKKRKGKPLRVSPIRGTLEDDNNEPWYTKGKFWKIKNWKKLRCSKLYDFSSFAWKKRKNLGIGFFPEFRVRFTGRLRQRKVKLGVLSTLPNFRAFSSLPQIFSDDREESFETWFDSREFWFNLNWFISNIWRTDETLTVTTWKSGIFDYSNNAGYIFFIY